MTTVWTPHKTIADLWVAKGGRMRWGFTCGAKDGFVLGVTEATPENTGIYTDKSQLQVNNANVTITDSNTVIKDQWFKAGVTLQGNLNRFQNCFIGESMTAASSSNYIAIQASNSTYYGNLFEQCTIIPTSPQVLDYGIVAANTSTHRCLGSSGWTDAVNWQTDTTVGPKQKPGSDVSAGDYFSPTVYQNDPHQKNGLSHSDAIQIANGRSHLVVGSTLHAIVGSGPNDTTSNYQNSHGIVVSPYAEGGIGGLYVFNTKFVGGGAQISAIVNPSTDWAPVVPNLVLKYNKFDAAGCLNQLKGGLYYPQSIVASVETLHAATLVGNVQINPCTPPSGGTAYGASATPANPVPVQPMPVKV